MWTKLTLCILLLTPRAWGFTYFVCLNSGTGGCTVQGACAGLTGADCSDACAGTTATGSGAVGPWCHIPGTRNTADNANASPTVTIAAGDTINVKAGTKQTSASAGGIRIQSSFYNNATQGSPITIRKDPNNGTGSYFTLDMTGVTIAGSFSGEILLERTAVVLDGLEILNTAAGAASVAIQGDVENTKFCTIQNSHFSGHTNTAAIYFNRGASTNPGWNKILNNIVDTFTIGGIMVDKDLSGYYLIQGNQVSGKSTSNNASDPIQIGSGSSLAGSSHVAIINNNVHDNANDSIDAGGHNCHDHYLVESNTMYLNTGGFKVHGNQQSDCATEDNTFNITRYNTLWQDSVAQYDYPNDGLYYHNVQYKGQMQIYTDCLPSGCGSSPPWNQNLGTASYGTGPGGNTDFGRETWKNNILWLGNGSFGGLVWINGGAGFRQSVMNSDIKFINNIFNRTSVGGNGDLSQQWWPNNSVGPSPAGLTSYASLALWEAITPDPPSTGGIDKTGFADSTMFVDATNRNFRLASGSVAINAGTWLTRTVGAGSNQSVVTVERASYFHDDWDPKRRCTGAGAPFGCCTGAGTDGGACGGPLLTPDSIRIGSNPAVSITAVDDVNNTITLSTPLSWASGDTIVMSNITDGQPDIGAFEQSPIESCSGCIIQSGRLN